MKRFLTFVAIVSPVVLAACAEQPLRQIVAEHKEQRIQQAYAGKPLGYGSGDGIGLYSARTEPSLTLTETASLTR